MSAETSPRSQPQVGSVVHAVAILRHLGAADASSGVTHIARAVGISPSSCFNILKTLVAENLVSFDPTTKAYSIGLGAVEIARAALRGDTTVRHAGGMMKELADRYDAAIGLWRVTPQERLLLVALAESDAAMSIRMAVGQRQPVAAGANGRAVLAMRGEDDSTMKRLFAGLRWQRAPAFAEWCEQLRDARRRGWALDVDQMFRGVTTYAAALVDTRNVVRFCLSAAVFTGRDTATQLEEIGTAVRDAARAIASDALD